MAGTETDGTFEKKRANKRRGAVKRTCSSVGQSTTLIMLGSVVRTHSCPHFVFSGTKKHNQGPFQAPDGQVYQLVR